MLADIAPSDCIFAVREALAAGRTGAAELAQAAEALRHAGMATRIMEEALDERVALSLAGERARR